MRLSKLQSYILLHCLARKGKTDRREFLKFYNGQNKRPKDKTKSITQSIERLIDKELMVGHGARTPHKWYIKEIKLTLKGRKTAKELLGKQQSLPL